MQKHILYDEEPVDIHYSGYRGMCTQMGTTLSELYRDDLEDDYFD